jgi:hypothetical protein
MMRRLTTIPVSDSSMGCEPSVDLNCRDRRLAQKTAH